MGCLPSFFVPTAGHLAAQVSQPREGGGGVAGRSLTDALLGQVLADWGKPSVEWNPLCTGHFKTPLSSIKHFFLSIFQPHKTPTSSPSPSPRDE